MNITTYYSNFSVKSFFEIDKTCIFSFNPANRTSLYMKTSRIKDSCDDIEYNCVNLFTGEYCYVKDDEPIYAPSAELTINW